MHTRPTERAALKQKLAAGVSLHMPAPRRIGKTWVMKRLAADLRDDDWLVIELDLQGKGAPSDLTQGLCHQIEMQQSFWKRLSAHARQRVDNLKGGRWGSDLKAAFGKLDPAEFLETLIASLNAQDGRTAILIDEIAYFFLELAKTDADAAKALAYQMRALRQTFPKVRWLFLGSIGLTTIARRYGLDGAFVDLDPFTLQVFTPDEARSFLRAPETQQLLSHPFDADDADFDWMFAELGWLAPYYLTLVANEVRPSACKEDGTPLATRDDIDAAFDALLQPDRKSAFCVWEDHVRKNLPAADQKIARHLMDSLSEYSDGEIQDTLLASAQERDGSVTRRKIKDILDMLLIDGLLTRTGDRYRFRSGLIRRYWQEYEAA